jgi:hypothetical protein
MTVLANINRRKGAKPYTVQQFMPQWDPGAPPERRPEMTGEEMLRAVKSINKRMGGKGGARSGDTR